MHAHEARATAWPRAGGRRGGREAQVASVAYEAAVSAFRKSAVALAGSAGKAVKWGWHIGPAAFGMAAVSVGAGGVVQAFAGRGGVYCGLIVAGVFGIAIDLKG